MSTIPSTTIPPGSEKHHFLILDGLRGVAAMVVVWFHVFEAYTTGHTDQIINHGYLAVDFFFMLSGFVIGYAYDKRMETLSTWEFLKRRLIRLQPMVAIGAVIGALIFYFQDCAVWDVSQVTVISLLVAMVANALLIPSPTGIEIRGLGEMYPLNGPSWSLFFEYIGNILYALFIRKLGTGFLTTLVLAAGVGLAIFSFLGPNGDICSGFSMTGPECLCGGLRVLYAFSAGLLLFRLFKPSFRMKHSFLPCSVALIILLAIPRLGGEEAYWMNSVYETLCFAILFPLILFLGAADNTTSPCINNICRFLGNISYPLYMVHYPFIYLYYAWVKNEQLPFSASLPGALALFFGSILLAWVCLKIYDVPIRKYLAERFLLKKKHH